MERLYPVYDSDGKHLGDYQWQEIIELFRDQWILEKGKFYLKPSEDSVIRLYDKATGAVHRFTVREFREMFNFDYTPDVKTVQDVIEIHHNQRRSSMKNPMEDNDDKDDDGARVHDAASETTVNNDRGMMRLVDLNGTFLGYFPMEELQRSYGHAKRVLGGKCELPRCVKRRDARLTILRRSLDEPLSENQRDEVFDEIDSLIPAFRVIVRNGFFVGYYSERFIRERWTVRRYNGASIVINEIVSKEERSHLLRQLLEDPGNLQRHMLAEIEEALGLSTSESVPKLVDKKHAGEKDPEEESVKRTGKQIAGKWVDVYLPNGRFLGVMGARSVKKRIAKWDPQFFEYDSEHSKLVIKFEMWFPHGDKRQVATILDEAYQRFDQTRSQERIGSRDARRRNLVLGYLRNRSEECRNYVTDLMLPAESNSVRKVVDREVTTNPELYHEIKSYEKIKLHTLALANAYDREMSEETKDLQKRAHVFVFDDDAWDEAMSCSDVVDRLPYAVCLVEDVLVWDVGRGIKYRELSGEAEASDAFRALSFIVDNCSARKARGGMTSFSRRTVADPLPGNIETGTLNSNVAATRHWSATCSNNRRARTPRKHTRRGHWRNQAYGPGMKLHKRIWISDTIVTPAGKYLAISSPTHVHRVTIA